MRGSSRAVGLALGWAADRMLGDPRRFHPVAGFGRAALALEARDYADSRRAGAVHHLLLVGAASALGAAAERGTGRWWGAHVAVTAVATWTVLGGRSLLRESQAIADLLDGDDLPAARRRLTHLVSRQTASLSGGQVARATIESVAENAGDAAVSPLLWGAVAGVPGLLAYRAVNTLDAMVGYRNERYLRFGWASARVDDLANWVPARIASALAVALSPLVGGSPVAAARAVREDAPAHPSPNGGRIEAAFAGALGVRLGGSNVYDGVNEDRGVLGDGRDPVPADIPRANRLADAVMTGAAVLAVGVAALRR